MKSLFLAVSAVVLFSSAAVAGDVVRQTNVGFGDLNLGSKDGVVALHNRLLTAANEVCADTKETTQAPYFEECRKAAVKKAIAEVGYKVAHRLATAQ
jgi:UrcA family protein